MLRRKQEQHSIPNHITGLYNMQKLTLVCLAVCLVSLAVSTEARPAGFFDSVLSFLGFGNDEGEEMETKKLEDNDNEAVSLEEMGPEAAIYGMYPWGFYPQVPQVSEESQD